MADSSRIDDETSQAFASHDAFQAVDEEYMLTSTVLDTRISYTIPADNDQIQFVISISAPSLDASVANESVPTVVESGWFDTFKRRLEDIFSVTRTESHDHPQIDHKNQEVKVNLSFSTRNPTRGVADAKALIEYVEGTYAQGLIPGYTYRGPAGKLESNALDHGAVPNEQSENQ